MRTLSRSPLLAYGLAVATVAVALGLTLLAWTSLKAVPLTLFWAAVTITAWAGGPGPGLVATVLAALAGEWLLVEPGRRLTEGLPDVLRVGSFLFVGAVISLLSAGRLRAERAQRRSEERLQAILDRTAAVVYLKDLDGRYLFVNEPFERLFHVTRDAARHRTSHDLFPAAMAERFRANDRSALAAGVPLEFEETVPHDDGLHTYISIKFPLTDASGVPYAVCGISTDITERKRAEDEVARQREWLRVTLGSIGDAVIATDVEGRVTFLNGVAEALTGWRDGDARGQPLDAVFRIVDEQTGAPSENPVRRVLRDGTVVRLANHTRLVARDGREVAIDDSGAPIRDASGNVRGVVLVFRDVSTRREAERRATFFAADAERRRREAEVIAELARSINAALDLDAVLQRITDGARELTACDLARIALREPGDAGMVFRSWVGTRYLGYESLRVDPGEGLGGIVVATGRPFRTENVLDDARLPKAHLSLIEAEGTITSMVVPIVIQGRVEGLLYVDRRTRRPFTDRDEAIVVQLADHAGIALGNLRLLHEAQAANHAKDEFLATLSHELRTPLTAVMGWVRMLRTGPLDGPTTARALETIERNSRLQAQLIEDLLDVSRIITGKLRLERRPVDLAPVIEAALDAVRGASEAKGIALTTTLDRTAGLVAGDPDRLQQVVWNLLSNAIKFTPRGGRVDVRLERTDSHVQIAVTDTGRGIPAAFLPFVFERFRQVDSTSTRAHGGLGLGLAIVRHLVEVHGGTVRARSDGEGRGSTFVVALPLMAAREEAALASAPTPPALTVPAPRILEGLRLLIVDDEVDARDLLTTILERAGAQVTSARSAIEALDVLERARPQVLISDIGLPHEDGYALIRRIRALDETRGGRVPALALTAYARADERTAALLAGYQMHMAKPVEPGELVAAVAGLARVVHDGPEAPRAP
jgi:PAS domain S-box-containing protein